VLTVPQKKVGVLAKEVPGGPFADEWKKAYSEVAKDQEEVDIALVISNAALAVKDEKELRLIRDASRASSGLMKDYFVEEMSSILDDEKKIGHDKLSQMVADKIDDSKFFQKIKVSNTFDSLNLDWATQPVVQSGGSYDLRFASDPDSNNLHAGVIVAALGLRYNSYSSLVARTYLVDPTKEQENNYKLLVSVHEVVLKAIRDGIQARDVYNKAVGLVKNSKNPELEKSFLKSVGYGIGIETKDTTLTLGSKSTRVLKDGMTLIVQTGFQDLENKGSQSKRGKSYSLAIVDTVRVTADGTAVFTKDAPYDLDSVSFFFNDDEEPAPKPKKEKKDSRIGAVAQTNVVTKRLRTDRTANQDAEKEAHRREHQKELHQRKQQQGMDKYSKGVGTLNGTEEKKFKRFQSYKREEDFPTRVKDLMIVADTKNQSIVLPIMGRPVPFHINTIKNASTTPEGDFTSIRINFLSPGQGVGRKDDQPFEDPNAHFVRSLTYRSKDGERMKSIAQSITDMKKENARREVEKKQLEDVVEQDKLIVDRRPQKLDLIFVRPALDGKRVPGEVQIHQNGLRYVHGGGSFSGAQTIDILSNNIRHVFFQPCKHELIVIIHIHLINPIMIGKRKTKDVQFYREATDMQFDETGNRKRKHRYGDEEEFEAEQEERRRRSELDKQFFKFAKSIEEAARDQNVRVDVPFRELGFNGVPSRSSVWIQPTTDCLVQLTEPPFMVVTLEDIEVVHLERVQVSFIGATFLSIEPC
jgi:nucleosome binding factor SPN SPT16 subunit